MGFAEVWYYGLQVNILWQFEQLGQALLDQGGPLLRILFAHSLVQNALSNKSSGLRLREHGWAKLLDLEGSLLDGRLHVEALLHRHDRRALLILFAHRNMYAVVVELADQAALFGALSLRGA